jgi:hypothetical protein
MTPPLPQGREVDVSSEGQTTTGHSWSGKWQAATQEPGSPGSWKPELFFWVLLPYGEWHVPFQFWNQESQEQGLLFKFLFHSDVVGLFAFLCWGLNPGPNTF